MFYILRCLILLYLQEIVRKTEFYKAKVQLEMLYTMEGFLMLIPFLHSKLRCIYELFEPGNHSSLQTTICLSDKFQWRQSETIKIKLDDDTVRCLRCVELPLAGRCIIRLQ